MHTIIYIFFLRPQCIDTYCMNTDEGRAQREEAKAKYLASLSKAKSNLANLDFTPNKNLTIQEQVDMIMSELQLKQKKRKSDEPEVIYLIKKEIILKITKIQRMFSL